MNHQAQVFLDKLGLDIYQSRVVTTCPFHNDSGASFSVDLDKAVFNCFGACSLPKGGGPIQFLMKWSKYRDGKEITYEQARKKLRREILLPSAQELAASHEEDKLLEIMKSNAHRALATLRVLDEAAESAADSWAALEAIYKVRSFVEWVAAEFNTTRARPSATARMLYEELARRRWRVAHYPMQRSLLHHEEWKRIPPQLEVALKAALSGENWKALLHDGLIHAQTAVTRQYAEKGQACRSSGNKSRPKSPTRTRVPPERTPVK